MNIENYDVKELTQKEAKVVNGGFWAYIGVAIMYYCWEFATNPQAHIDAFKEGMEMAKK